MFHLSVHLMPRNLPADSPQWEQYAWRVRAARLDSLRLDPDSFISTYESEAKQPIDFTIGRLKESNAWHVFVVRNPNEAASRDPDVLLHEDTEYVGFCVMIDTRSVPKAMIRREGTGFQVKQGDWYMAAVYVDRSVRGTGAGKRMIQFGIDTIREVAQKTETDAGVCVTNVVHGNNSALQLYKSMGFQVTNVDDMQEKEGRKYHTTQLQLRI